MLDALTPLTLEVALTVQAELEHRVLEQLTAFDGLGPDCCTPPDTQAAVGPDSVVEMVNTTGRTTNKAGGNASDFNLSDFFGAPVIPMNEPRYSDPRVIYDDLSDRFFAAMLIFDGCDGCATEDDSEIDIAVSGSNQPTGWIGPGGKS